MSYGTSREEKIRELPGLIAAASGAIVRCKVIESEARTALMQAEQASANESARLVHLVNELKDLALKTTDPAHTPRDAVAKAFGWMDWDHVVKDSERDGYTEAGGRGSLAAAIGRAAAEAQALIEHCDRYLPADVTPHKGTDK